MNKWLFLFLFAISPFFAEEPSFSLWDYHPLHMGGNLIRIGKADISAPEGGHLHFRKSNAFLTMLVPISKESYFFPHVEWNAFTMEWNKNPRFNKNHFYYLQFALTFYTTSIEKWRWILKVDYNLDLEHFSLPSLYSLYSGLVWGAYQIHRKWHYHVGALGYKGMEGETVYPLIGADFAPNKHWLFQCIFPIEYSIEYKAGRNWRFALKGRPLKERFRVGSREPFPRSILNYSTIGAEFNTQFKIERRFELEIYGGYNFGGHFYIKDRHGHQALYTHVQGAPYAGLNLDFGF